MSKTTKMIHVDLQDDSDHPDGIETFEKLRAKSGVGNIHRTYANSPTVFKNIIGLAHALRFTTKVDHIDRELALCVVLERHQGHYELAPHQKFAILLGATEEQVLNVRNPARRDLYSERQQAILRFAERFAADPSERDSLPDDRIEDYLDNRQRIELGVNLAVYMGLAHFTSLFDVPPESFDGPNAPDLQRTVNNIKQIG
jgi:alkylhydroperoxidase family enzyme